MSHSSPYSEHLDLVYAALAHGKRRAIITTLAFRPATVGQLAEEHGLSLPAIHKHIRILEAAQLLQRRKVGRTNFVAMKRRGFLTAQGWLKEFHAEWGNDQETLENYIRNFSKDM